MNQKITWIKTNLKDFGFKCLQSKHDLCFDLNCACLCHGNLIKDDF